MEPLEMKCPVIIWAGGVICPVENQVSLWPLRAKGMSTVNPLHSFSLPVNVSLFPRDILALTGLLVKVVKVYE